MIMIKKKKFVAYVNYMKKKYYGNKCIYLKKIDIKYYSIKLKGINVKGKLNVKEWKGDKIN